MTFLDTSKRLREGYKISKWDSDISEWETVNDGIPSEKEAEIQWDHLVKYFPLKNFRMTFVTVSESDVRYG